ncbi:hypothetical protein CEXT_655561 [Caerostris extrusa]|uniref:Uncharacterized protein n=1 Tax=Caerostris extrusa TaxID=172846 RepID=A0AAV4MR86_CAEEX|nr:hypothetical protein CEXT_655561 [Caerostris extrusa]
MEIVPEVKRVLSPKRENSPNVVVSLVNVVMKLLRRHRLPCIRILEEKMENSVRDLIKEDGNMRKNVQNVQVSCKRDEKARKSFSELQERIQNGIDLMLPKQFRLGLLFIFVMGF